MTLRIIKHSDPITVEHLNLTLYGPPGVGKTSLAFTADKPLLFDCDGGAYRAGNRKDSVGVTSWSDIATVSAADLAPYNTVIVDTAGRALDWLAQDIIRVNPKMGRAGSLSLQGFGQLKAQFSAWLKALKMMGKDVVLIAHMDEQRNGDDVIERLDVQGGSKGEIYKSMDAMGRIFVRGNGREIDFSPRENSFGKNPCNLDVLPFPDPSSAPELLAGIIADIKSRLNQQVKQQIDTARAVTDWTLAIEDYSTVEQFNEALSAGLKDAPKAAKLHANKRAKSLGFTFDPSAGAYRLA